MALFDFLHRRVSAAEISTLVANAGQETAMRELALDIAVSYVAGAISKCEFKHYVGGKEVKDELYFRFNVSPNPNQNSSQFLTQVINKLIRKGEALVIKENKDIYCVDSFSVERHPLSEDVFSGISIGGEMIQRKYLASDVFLYKLDETPLVSVINRANYPYCNAFEAALKAYKRNIGKKYKLLINARKAGDRDFNEEYEKIISKQLKQFIESDTGVYPQFDGYDLQDVTPSTVSGGTVADVSALRKEIFETTAAGLKIPVSMLYGNITNINDVVNVFLSFCIDPIADMLSEETTRKTIDFKSWKKGDCIKVDTGSIKHVDVLELADNISKYVSSGVPDIDEVRSRIGLNEIGGELGKKHFITKNYEDAENLNQI